MYTNKNETSQKLRLDLLYTNPQIVDCEILNVEVMDEKN